MSGATVDDMTTDTMRPATSLEDELNRRLFNHRALLLGDVLEQANSNHLCQGLMLLAAEDDHTAITLLINSPGGSVPGMLAIRDCMRAVPCDVVTVNLGMAYSAGQFLLSAGTPGRRHCLPHAKVLLHQGSAGFGGSAMDIAIQADDMRHTRDTVLGLIADDTGQPIDVIERDSRRDRWFTADQARDYGFVDHVSTSLTDVLPVPARGVGIEVPR